MTSTSSVEVGDKWPTETAALLAIFESVVLEASLSDQNDRFRLAPGTTCSEVVRVDVKSSVLESAKYGVAVLDSSGAVAVCCAELTVAANDKDGALDSAGVWACCMLEAGDAVKRAVEVIELAVPAADVN